MANARFPRDNLDATTDPGPTDDADAFYGPASRWFNTVTNTLYFCTDATAGAAVWVAMSVAVTAGLALSFVYGSVGWAAEAGTSVAADDSVQYEHGSAGWAAEDGTDVEVEGFAAYEGGSVA